MKKHVSSVGPLARARRVMLCCSGHHFEDLQCVPCSGTSSDGISDISNASRRELTALGQKLKNEKTPESVCLIQHSPFRILRVILYTM